MPETIEPPAENNAPAKEYDIHDIDNYCRVINEYDDWLEDNRNRGLRNKECDYIMEFLNWLLTVKETTLTVKDLRGEVKGVVVP